MGFDTQGNKKQNRSWHWGQSAWKKALPALLLCFFSLVVPAGCGEEALVTSLERAGEDSNSDKKTESEEAALPQIYVHVCGAVRDPGLKLLENGSRAWQALEAAGGLTPEADAAAINLAKQLQDGEQLYFPTLEETSRDLSENREKKINLNTADEEELCSLPGIGSARAKAILKYRGEKGAFRETAELMEVPGIKQALYDQICDLVYVP